MGLAADGTSSRDGEHSHEVQKLEGQPAVAAPAPEPAPAPAPPVLAPVPPLPPVKPLKAAGG